MLYTDGVFRTYLSIVYIGVESVDKLIVPNHGVHVLILLATTVILYTCKRLKIYNTWVSPIFFATTITLYTCNGMWIYSYLYCSIANFMVLF